MTIKEDKKSKMNGLTDEMIKKDPFLMFGFGMIAFRSLLRSLIFLFFIMSLLSLPISIFYYKGANNQDFKPMKGYGAITLGNMGYNS